MKEISTLIKQNYDQLSSVDSLINLIDFNLFLKNGNRDKINKILNENLSKFTDSSKSTKPFSGGNGDYFWHFFTFMLFWSAINSICLRVKGRCLNDWETRLLLVQWEIINLPIFSKN